ncbi:phage portal protein, HK97 family [Nitratireductor aquibiodomus]|uniref:Phage portal protein, HK97 family n=1 Tax=Nitratireductor aquibiodomus TaxID=204799 RepID=A0A1H4JB17_9HYPH|nr:phage portal protein [Nitratireductor aquibiodomus]SEB43529.1 phage portal protein, HK97 family [Nitratireductor aquibiodomus]
MWPFTSLRQTGTETVHSPRQGGSADEQRSLANPEDWLLELFGAVPVASGVSVNPRSALSVPAVRAAVELIAGTASTLPVKVFRHAPNGGKEVAANHSAYSLAHDTANPWTSAGALRAQITMDALLTGGGFAYANRASDGRVVELIRLPANSVSVETDTLTGEPRYRLNESAGQRFFTFRDIIHVAPLASLDGVNGEAPIRTAREAIGLCITLEAHAARLFANQGRPSGFLKFARALAPDAMAKMRASWQAMTRSGGTAILDADADYRQLTLASTDAQFAEMRAFQIVEIARAFNVPPTFLADFSRATWSNLTEANRQLVTFSLMPWFRSWEAAYRRVLLSDEDRQSGITVEFVVDGLLQGNASERAEAVAKFRAAGVMTSNEARRLENLPAMDGGDKLENPYTTTGGTNE